VEQLIAYPSQPVEDLLVGTNLFFSPNPTFRLILIMTQHDPSFPDTWSAVSNQPTLSKWLDACWERLGCPLAQARSLSGFQTCGNAPNPRLLRAETVVDLLVRRKKTHKVNWQSAAFRAEDP